MTSTQARNNLIEVTPIKILKLIGMTQRKYEKLLKRLVLRGFHNFSLEYRNNEVVLYIYTKQLTKDKRFKGIIAEYVR